MDYNIPLAHRMRPESLEEFIGHEEIVGRDKILYRMIKANRLHSMIFWGNPGTGKTSLANIISKEIDAKFISLNAVNLSVTDLKQILEEKETIFESNKRKIIFIDEIHRFNKLQQDALLPYVENGKIILIGATTENPVYTVNKGLISRMLVFHLNDLCVEDVIKALKNSLESEKGLKKYNVKISDETIRKIAMASGNDIRTALNSLEIAVITTFPNKDGNIIITDEIMKNSIQKNKIVFDKDGEGHYQIISALIKSIRGSDVDAALHYLARLIESGEDPLFIARRLCISAVEDVGQADPNAIVISNSCLQSLMQIGMPEGRLLLAHSVIYLANAKKSNAGYLSINKAISDIKNRDIGEIPKDLINSTANDGEKYVYPHDFEDHYIEHDYMPDKLKGTKYYFKDKWAIDTFIDKLKK